jgi:lipopolysaccharide transport system ATP-binding protein
MKRSMKPAIRVEKLSKSYRLGSRAANYRTLRETITESVAGAWHGLRRRRNGAGNASTKDNALWALKDVSFEVQPGEVVGIIGRNGAGKSTLLKILSRITEPAAGRAEVRGRIGSLLEVGTGFHPELTGRENIYLNGSILGMSRKEIDRQFDAIVSFAEIDRFLDVPVKRYSSGMYVRLAFAVAAHLEPEILVVDEVLAVGDVVFQKKCLRKMQEVGRAGRTVLFVSHNLDALKALCSRGVVLRQGELVADGSVSEAVAYYLKGLESSATTSLRCRTDRGGAGQVRLVRVEINGDGANEDGLLVMGRALRFTFHLNGLMPGLTCIFTVYDQYGCALTRFNSGFASLEDHCDTGMEPRFECAVEELLLAPGRYRVDAALLANGEMQDRVEAAAFFEVTRGTVRGREVPRVDGDWKFCLPHSWQSPG